MKTFKELLSEKLNEGADLYPADEMTKKELKIAVNAAKNIIDMLEDGSPLMRWQISAIVKASEELASVCTSMRADEEDEDEEYGEYDSPDYGYPSFYEHAEINEANQGKVVGTENGYPIHDMGERFPYKDKRFLVKDPILDVWQSSAPTLNAAKEKAKSLKPAEGRGLKKTRTDHDDWSDEMKQKISSGEIRKAVMSRK
jgi:hypothetical protein